MGNNYTTMAGMRGDNPAAAKVPTQTFNSANILGTPAPAVGDQKGNPDYASRVGRGVTNEQVVLVAVALFAVGYLAFHFNFEL